MRKILAACLLWGALSARAATTVEWLDDFHYVLAEVASHYANLDSVINDRRVDLAAVQKRTEDRIRAATNDREAQTAIDQYLAAFGDGHAFIRWTLPSPPSPQQAKLCDRLGYASRDFGGVNFTRLTEYTPSTDADSSIVPGGLLKLADNKTAGVVRIHLFSENVHPSLCVAAMESLQLKDDSACEGDCRHRVDLAVADRLTAAVERRIDALQRAGATLMVVDVTGNGGGSNWVEPAARVFTAIPLKSPRMGFIRHPHWVKDFNSRLSDVKLDLDKHPDDPLLLLASGTLHRAIDEASKKPGGIVSDLIYAGGLVQYAKPGSLDRYEARGVLFNASLYRYHEGVNRLPLYVLVDGNTASASEYFAAMLQDNRAATIVGVPTRGAGCGYTNGGIEAILPHSGAKLNLSDCVRLRADGSNEVLGIIPDVLVPWSAYDSAFQRAAKARDALKSRNTGGV